MSQAASAVKEILHDKNVELDFPFRNFVLDRESVEAENLIIQPRVSSEFESRELDVFPYLCQCGRELGSEDVVRKMQLTKKKLKLTPWKRALETYSKYAGAKARRDSISGAEISFKMNLSSAVLRKSTLERPPLTEVQETQRARDSMN